MTSEYLCVYDYGMGGVWRVVLAESPEAISTKYPHPKVLLEPPDWMSEAKLMDIKARSTVALDDDTDPFLSSLRDSAGHG